MGMGNTVKKILSVLLCLILLCVSAPVVLAAGETYYVDAVGGSDSNSGTSPDAAWASLTKAASVTFSAGDRLLLKCGEVFAAGFDTHGSGTPDAPVTVSCYGEGARPVIVNDNVFPGFIIHNVSGWVIENLEFTAPQGAGAVMIFAHGGESVENITLRDCVLHDISLGSDSTNSAAIIIGCDDTAARVRKLHFDGLKIENVSWGIHMSGITAESTNASYESPDASYNSDFLMERIYIRGAKYGGIVISAVQDCIVRNCRVLDSATAPKEAYAPLWMHHTNRTTVEYCEIAGSTNPRDGMAIDFDGWTTNSTYRYIYSHDNNRFMRNCVFDAKTKNAGNSVYNCVSVNDRKGISHSASALISSRNPSFSRMAGFRFHDNILVGAKPILWAGTIRPEVDHVIFCGTPFMQCIQRILNFFSTAKGFTFPAAPEDLDARITEITANLPTF